jgi:catechol 2,3-dioxygenase-like lactoylglutathione lyase family enzyme
VEEAIPVLRVADATAAADWYGRLGWVEEWVHRFEPGFPAFVSIARDGAARIFLSEHRGDASPDTLVYVRVADIDSIAAVLGVAVEDQPWAREVHTADPDGNRLRFGTPR